MAVSVSVDKAVVEVIVGTLVCAEAFVENNALNTVKQQWANRLSCLLGEMFDNESAILFTTKPVALNNT